MYGKKLKELRDLEGWTQEDVAKKLGVTKQTYSNYENEKRKPGLDMIQKLSEVYQVDIDRVFGNEPDMIVRENGKTYEVEFKANHLLQIPILGTIAAGEPILAQQNILGYAPAPPMMKLQNRNVFYLEIKGESMNREFTNGSFVLVERGVQVENGEIAAVLVNGDEATVKKINRKDNILTLIPMSNDESFYPEAINLENTEVNIIGKVIGAFKQY
ncbi:LexA family protein [Paucisalibacillus globulus]|uniref:LexA family protein n=1 Tax=Paucisalibacillus globulus TaxID=351095 RepID=UPI000429E9B4|nr:S24 family peptidase [Paucisalibacillus globulus]